MAEGRILVVGGGGFYGRYLVADLLRFSGAEILVASRHPPARWAEPDRVRSAACDLRDVAGLERLAAGCDVLVHCAGPFHTLPLNPLHAAMRAGAHYVDIAEDRHFARGVRALEEPIRQTGITVASGMSVAPAMEALFAEMLREHFDSLSSLRTFAAPDTRKHRGRAMFHTMLTGVGRPFQQPGDGNLRLVRGWTEPEWVEFPPPLGRRLTYLVLEMADLDLLPELFGVKTVEFKAGTEWPLLNRLLGAAARMRALTGHPDWERFTPLVRGFSWLAGRLGKDEGGVIFEVGGLLQGRPVSQRLAVVARRDGGLIPAVLASMATARLLSGRLTTRGILPVHQWITSEELVRELQARGLELWRQPHGVPGCERFE
jgi:hypothetical protein